MTLNKINSILLTIVLSGILLCGLFVAFIFVTEIMSFDAPPPVVTATEPTETTDEAEELNLVFSKRGAPVHFQETYGPRILMEQGKDHGSKLSGYIEAATRNVGHIDRATLEQRWYFPTNNQNILNIYDQHSEGNDHIYHLRGQRDDAPDWYGVLIRLVDSDTNNDNALSDEDRQKLVWIDASFKPELVLDGIEHVEMVDGDAGSQLILFEKDGTEFIGKFDPDHGEFTLIKELQPAP